MKITKQNSPIDSIDILVSLYKGIGITDLRLKSHDYRIALEIESELRAIASPLNIRLSMNSEGGSLVIKSYDAKKTRVLLDLLFHHDYISNTDRADIEPKVRECERALINREKISQADPTSAQLDIMTMLAEPYIDELMEKTNEYVDIIPILVVVCSEWARAETFEEWFFTKYQSKLDPATLDCLSVLCKMLHGEVDLATTFLRSGDNIPSLAIQRKILVNEFQKKAAVKFPFEQSEYKRFYIHLSLAKLVEDTWKSLSRRISNRYEIDWLSGFPKENISKPVTFSPGGNITSTYACTRFFSEKRNVYTTFTQNEETLLNKFELKRFPVSEIELALAKKENPLSIVIKSDDDLLLAVDGSLHYGLSVPEKLYLAISTHDLLGMKQLITEFEINLALVQEFNPFILAVDSENLAAIQEFITLGADVNFVETDGYGTLLSRAAYRENLPIIAYLVEQHAQIEKTDRSQGRVPLHYLFSASHLGTNPPSVVQFKSMINLLSANSLDMLNNQLDSSGDNCLLIAAKNAHLLGIMALLELGVSVEAQNSRGLTAYDIISNLQNNNPLRDNDEVLELLRPKGLQASAAFS